MKFFAVIALSSLAIVANIQADTSVPNYDDFLKKASESLGDLAKKFEEVSGVHVDYDKQKFLQFGKSVGQQLEDVQKKLKEYVEANSKNFPGGDDLKKKFEELQKQTAETFKNLNSPEVQKSAQKLQETVSVGLKKTSEALNDLAEKFGVAAPPAVKKSLNEWFEEWNKSVQKLQEKAAKVLEDAQAELKKKKN